MQGTYISWTTGKMYSGPQIINETYTLYEMPLFVKAGSIIPMKVDGFNDGNKCLC